MVKTSIDQEKLIGGRKKNGHSDHCDCHICQNMMKKAERGEYTKENKMKQFRKKGLIKKKNGHAPDCDCPICKNMMNKKKKGGDSDDVSDSEDFLDKVETFKNGKGGSKKKSNKKKSNGHKANCKCPICKNMKKTKKGGATNDEDSDSDNKIVTDMSDSDSDLSDIPSVSDKSDSDEETETTQEDESEQQGGTRKRRGKKSNGHKANCKCPICKNMKKGRKTRRQKKRTSKRRY